MMIGVPHVIGMKPTLRFGFSILPLCANASLAAASGKSDEIAASAVPLPTACRKLRRVESSGKSARMTAFSTTRLCSASASVGWLCACSAALACCPQLQPPPSFTSASNGFLNADIACLLCYALFSMRPTLCTMHTSLYPAAGVIEEKPVFVADLSFTDTSARRARQMSMRRMPHVNSARRTESAHEALHRSAIIGTCITRRLRCAPLAAPLERL